MRGELENLEKPVCIALGRVQYDTTTSQDYRSMINCYFKFRFGRDRDFLALLLLPLAGGPKDGKRFDAD